jgi:hypothetical protein
MNVRAMLIGRFNTYFVNAYPRSSSYRLCLMAWSPDLYEYWHNGPARRSARSARHFPSPMPSTSERMRPIGPFAGTDAGAARHAAGEHERTGADALQLALARRLQLASLVQRASRRAPTTIMASTSRSSDMRQLVELRVGRSFLLMPPKNRTRHSRLIAQR